MTGAGGQADAATHFAYAATVTSVRSMQKLVSAVGMRTIVAGQLPGPTLLADGFATAVAAYASTNQTLRRMRAHDSVSW